MRNIALRQSPDLSRPQLPDVIGIGPRSFLAFIEVRCRGFDLVSCRNLLIYLETTIQEKLTQLFHFALVPEGVLLLGSSESTTKGKGYFEPISKSRRIFRKKKPNPSKKAFYPG